MDDLFAIYPQYEYLLAQIQLVLFMLGMGATLSPKDFKPVFQQPVALCYGVVFELLLAPFVALLLCWLTNFTDGLAIGLLLVGCLPGGTLSNVFTYISRANVPLSIALSATATLLSIVTIPLLLNSLVHYLPTEISLDQFSMPVWETIQEIILCLMLPLAVGMLIARYRAGYSPMISKWSMRLGFFFVIIMVVGSLGSGRVDLERYSWWQPLVIILFCVLVQQLTMLPIRLRKWPPSDYAAIGIESTIRNVYLGVLVTAILAKAALGEGQEDASKDVLFVVLFYGPVSMGTALPLTLRIRRLLKRQPMDLPTT